MHILSYFSNLSLLDAVLMKGATSTQSKAKGRIVNGSNTLLPVQSGRHLYKVEDDLDMFGPISESQPWRPRSLNDGSDSVKPLTEIQTEYCVTSETQFH
ncbi:hypothetical protein BaRGS_00032748 [Batillaria attramentaria]|uniref:Uncharacterized protein n=1 Tax=Batillaria attramentaria TaxID=370345 RepID=A0ABD0JMX3_9CAEN